MSGLNIKDSAIAAGYSESTARQSGSRLEKDNDVVRYFDRMGFQKPAKQKSEKPKVKDQPEPAEVKAAESIADKSTILIGKYEDPVEYMKAVVNAEFEDPKLRLDAAKAWDAAIRGRAQAKGKKEEKADAAKKVAGRFSTAQAPMRIVK